MFWIISRVSGSTVTGPRGLTQDSPFMASTKAAPSVEPWVFFSAS